jgi:hypothetical protein
MGQRLTARAGKVDNRDAEDHDRDADRRADAGKPALDSFDRYGDRRDEKSPGIHPRGRPAAQRGVEPEVNQHLPADDQIRELRIQ